MLRDFEMIEHVFPNREDIIVYPVADVHLGSAEHMTSEWNAFVKKIKSQQNSYVMLVGDLVNNSTKTSVSNVYDEVIRPRDQKEQMTKYLEPLRDRILCAVSGNHERRSGKDVDQDITYDIMCKLDLEHLYRENIAFVKLKFGKTGSHADKNPVYNIAVTHGSGGGALPGGVINRNERFAYGIDGIDALVTAHSHEPMASVPAKLRLDPTHNEVRVIPFKVVVATAWLDYSGYPVQKQLLPKGHSINYLTLRGKHRAMEVTMK